jgi:hypothetical protein
MPLYLIKYRLVTYPVLAFPQFEHPFKLATDASDIGLGAVLFQEYGGREHVVAYASRSLRPLKRTTLQQRGKHWPWFGQRKFLDLAYMEGSPNS